MRKKLFALLLAAAIALPAITAPDEAKGEIIWYNGDPRIANGASCETVDWSEALEDPVKLYSAPSGRSTQLGMLEPQTVRVTKLCGSFRATTTEYGEAWYYPGGRSYINVQEIDEEITLPTTRSFMAGAPDWKTTLLKPQQLQAIARADGGFYLVNTPVGNAWIFLDDYELVDKQETLMKPVTLYTEPSGYGKASGTLEPQTVTVSALYNGYHQVELDHGTFWYRSKWPIFDREEIDEVLALGGTTPIYDYPNGSSRVAAELLPQQVRAIAKADGGWYQVKTWIGDKWLHPEITLASAEPYGEPLALIRTTNLIYEYPSQQSRTLSVYRNHIAIPTAKTPDGWYKIKEYDREGWVHVPDEWLPQPVQRTVTVTKETSIFLHPYTEIRSMSTMFRLAPQQVKATMQWEDHWFLIHLWHGGQGWIYVEDE